MFPQQPLKETLSGLPVAALLKKYINHFTVLIDGPPKVMLLTLDLHEHFIDVERIAVALMFSSQPLRVLRSEFVAPETDGFVADLNAALSEQVFNISMT